MTPVFDANTSHYLQFMGRPCTGAAHVGASQPIGERLFLQCGTISDQHDGLGLTNRGALPLPEVLLQGRWLIEAYAFYDQPTGGQALHHLPLCQALLLNTPRLPLLPPGALQPGRPRQPRFHHWLLERNPCLGWRERIHLYQQPGKPFEATSILYLNQTLQITAAELFHAPLLQDDGSRAIARRAWVQFTDYPDS